MAKAAEPKVETEPAHSKNQQNQKLLMISSRKVIIKLNLTDEYKRRSARLSLTPKRNGVH